MIPPTSPRSHGCAPASAPGLFLEVQPLWRANLVSCTGPVRAFGYTTNLTKEAASVFSSSRSKFN